MFVSVVLVISILLQFAAAVLALRLIRITGRRAAWALIAAAILLMAIRRSITLYHVVVEGSPHPADLATELVALVISILMVSGIVWIGPLFHSFKRSEEALRKSEERFQQVAANAKEWIWEVDANGLYTYASPVSEMILGYKPDEIAGQKHFYDFFHPEDREELKQAALDVFKDRTPFHDFVNRNVARNGKVLWLSTSGTPILDEQGNFAGYRGADVDVTERKRAEEERRNLEAQIQHAQKLESLGVLAGGIAHDFNNLLVGILGYADLAMADLSSTSPARASIQGIERAAKRAADLTRQLLAYSGRGRFVIEALDLNEVVNEITHLLEVSISKKVVLKYNFAENLPAIEADATQIRQVIMNLITNASEAIGEKSGVISISTGALDCDRAYLNKTNLDEDLSPGLYVYIEVADTGCGMDGETCRKIFDPFFTTKFTGRGLGLAAVMGIVRGHQGALKVYSEPGRGTTFKVLFPALDEPAASRAKEALRAEAWHGSGTVLLVDDEETVCAVGRQMLERVGFTVLTARDGPEALDLFRQQADEIVCVVLDLTMPHMDGEVAYRELRRIRGDVRVIMSSGYNEQEVTQRFAGKGLAGFIQKPYHTEELVAKLREVLKE
ncbi:MAG: PAS domain S-box protein [Phycisphaerae bacterium]|nr:PAS domain S-box protein [Phycisphaerae bacterium]